MSFAVEIQRRAEGDVAAILEWLHARSPSGAQAWKDAFDSALDDLRQRADDFPVHPQSRRLKRLLRYVLVRTRHGQNYQIIFVIDDSADIVRILRVRSPGQRSVRNRDLN